MLALRFPYGKAAWGGKFAVLPYGFRRASALFALLLVFLAVCILERGRLINLMRADTAVMWVIWLFTVFFAFDTLMKFNSQSRVEKKYAAPFAFSLFVLFLIVSVSAG